MEFLKQMNVWQKRGLAAVLGGVAGYAYYYYIGCVSGTCAITSNPYISTGYGILIGALLIDRKKKKETAINDGTDNTATDPKV